MSFLRESRGIAARRRSPDDPQDRSDRKARYAVRVTGIALFKLFLTGYAVVGIAYVCIGSGAFSSEQDNWWGSLPQVKKNIFISAIAATILQSFI